MLLPTPISNARPAVGMSIWGQHPAKDDHALCRTLIIVILPASSPLLSVLSNVVRRAHVILPPIVVHEKVLIGPG